MIAFLKFVFAPAPVQRRFRYDSRQYLWCPICLKWVREIKGQHNRWATIWIRRARRWFQGKRDHENP